MTRDYPTDHDPAVATALADLRTLILQQFPDAQFSIAYRDDPPGTRLRVIIDSADVESDDVLDAVIDKLFEVQVGQELPIYVIPVQPPSRLPQQIHSASERQLPADLDIARLTVR